MTYKWIYTLFLFSICHSSFCQPREDFSLKGEFTEQDSVDIAQAFANSKWAVNEMYVAMDSIWSANQTTRQNSKKYLRQMKWKESPSFTRWLGQPDRIGLAMRRIRTISKKFDKKMVFEVVKENKGRCTGWISAWTIPFGKVRIHLCEDFFAYRTYLQEKVLVHELGHEAGILFHRRIHGCRAARKAAKSTNNKAKRSTENYAWLAMSFLSINCSY